MSLWLVFWIQKTFRFACICSKHQHHEYVTDIRIYSYVVAANYLFLCCFDYIRRVSIYFFSTKNVNKNEYKLENIGGLCFCR